MNLLDCVVIKVLGRSCVNRVYKVKVQYNCYGIKHETELSFDSEMKADEVKEGYYFLA